MTAQEYLESLRKAVIDAEITLQLRQEVLKAAQRMQSIVDNTGAPDAESEWRKATADDIGQPCRVFNPNDPGQWFPGILRKFSPEDAKRPYTVELVPAQGYYNRVSKCQVQKKG
jgi:hypothetical protein